MPAISKLFELLETYPFILGIWIIFICASAFGFLGGWTKLAKHYKFESHFEGQKWKFQSLNIGKTNYTNLVTVGSSSRGLYLSIFILFRLGHPSILIPWEQLIIKREKIGLNQYNSLQPAACPRIKIFLSDRLFYQISEASAGNIPLPSNSEFAFSKDKVLKDMTQSNILTSIKIKISPKLCLKIFALTFSIGLAVGLFNHGLAQYQAWQFPERYSIHLPGEYTSPRHGDDWPDSFQEFLGLSHAIRVKVEQRNEALVSETYYSIFGANSKIHYQDGEWISTGGGVLAAPLYFINCVIPLATSWLLIWTCGALPATVLTSQKNPEVIRRAEVGFTVLMHTAITGFLTFPLFYHLPSMFFFFRDLEASLPPS